jgi:hypothetical protein
MAEISIEAEFSASAAENGAETLVTLMPEVDPIIAAILRESEVVSAEADARFKRASDLYSDYNDLLRKIGHMERDWLRNPRWKTTETVAERDKLTARAEKLKQKREQVLAENPRSIYPAKKLQAFLARVSPYSRFEHVSVAVPDETSKAQRQLEKVRGARVDLLSRRRQIEMSALPVQEALAAAQMQVDSIASKGRPNISATLRMPKSETGRRHQGEIRFQKQLAPGSLNEVPDVWSFVFWLCQDEINAKIAKAIEAEAARHTVSIPRRDRPALLAELDTQLDRLAYEEAACINAIGDAREFPHRHDADPLHVLQLRRLPDAERPDQSDIRPMSLMGATLGVALTAEQAAGWNTGVAKK